MGAVPEATSPVPNRPALLNAYRAVAGLFALLVLVQAAMAGQAIYGDWSITAHGVVGNLSYLLAVAGLVIGIVARVPRTLVAVALAIVVLSTLQIILGYDDGQAANAWHLPNGVAIFGLAVYQVSVVRRTATASPVA
jgi:uncharacterized membrane protein